MEKKLRKIRKDIFKIIWQSLTSVQPESAVNEHIKLVYDTLFIGNESVNLNVYKNIYVLGAGKAAAWMGRAIEDIFTHRIKGGLVCTKYNHCVNLNIIPLAEAGHPVPDENGYLAAKKTLEFARKCKQHDLVICLLSGGASALWVLPQAGITLGDKQKCTELLLASGADIYEQNIVRKHISRIKGGRLAKAAFPARVITLAISDVVGDELSAIGSGPTVGDPSSFGDAINVLRKYNLTDKIPASVFEYILQGLNGQVKDTPTPDDPVFKGNISRIISSNRQLLEAARKTGEYLGYDTHIQSTDLTGEAREVGRRLIALARREAENSSRPKMLLFGGETTVTLKGDGKGGRNQELALAAALELNPEDHIMLASVGTDGTDGPTDAAGAFADNTTCVRAAEAELSPAEFLEKNNSYEFFDRLGDLIKTGPTGTNVMDMQVVVIY